METKQKPKKMKETTKVVKEIVSEACKDRDCPIHGNLKVRGKTFKGTVVSKQDKRIAIEFERMIYLRKYERYAKTKTKIHARLPKCKDKEIEIGDIVKIKECRPLSKIIHFVFLEKMGGEK